MVEHSTAAFRNPIYGPNQLLGSASDGCDKERRRNEEEQRGQTDRVRLSARHIKVDGLQYRERVHEASSLHIWITANNGGVQERYSISKNSKRQKPTGARKENLRRTVKEENQTTEENLLAVAEDNKQERRELFEATTLPGHGTNSPNLQETELVGALPDKIGVCPI